MTSSLALAFLLAPLIADSGERYWEGCNFVKGFSIFAYRMAVHEGVEESRFHIADDADAVEEVEMKRAILHDVYHDLKSLRERVERACAPKVES